MNRILIQGGCLGLALGGLSACANPYPEYTEYTVNITDPAADASKDFTFDATIEIGGGFKLTETACGIPTVQTELLAASAAANVYIAHLIADPEFDAFQCTGVDETGNPPLDQGNIQFFVDGLIQNITTGAESTVPVDLTPRWRVAIWDYQYDADGNPIDFNGNAPDSEEYNPQGFFDCAWYYPEDQIGYFATYMNDMAGFYQIDLYDPAASDLVDDDDDDETNGGDGDGIELVPATNDQDLPTLSYELLLYNVGFIPNILFDYNADSHVYSAELHYNNHALVYGANRSIVEGGKFSASALELGAPADSCQALYDLGPVDFLKL